MLINGFASHAPIANKIGSQNFCTLRDSFIGTMPVIMILSRMVNAFLSDLPGRFGWTWISSADG